jgi:hypothetical protein
MLLVGVEVLDRVAKPAGLDIGEPFAGYSQNVGALPLPGDRLSKARQWCRALQRQIWATWWAAVETNTHLTPDGMHHETETVSVEAGLAVASAQVLYEVFLGAYPRKKGGTAATSAFETFCHAHPDGQAASGLKLIRNGEMHSNSIVLPRVPRVVGVTFDDGSRGLRIFPQWAEYDELPQEIREARRDPGKGKPPGSGALMTNQIHHDHYRDVVAGTPVVEPLMEAFAFFARCDPRIVRIAEDGEPQHFPLVPISERDYERRHPDWPSRKAVEMELRSACESEPPLGTSRVCVAHATHEDGVGVAAHFGYTILEGRSPVPFTESPEQIARDITEFGYEYWTEHDGVAYRLIVDANGEVAGDITSQRPSALHSADTSPWESLYVLSQIDAFAYRNQRRPQP